MWQQKAATTTTTTATTSVVHISVIAGGLAFGSHCVNVFYTNPIRSESVSEFERGQNK